MLRSAGNYYFCSVSIGGKMSIKVKPVICFAALRMSKFSSSGNWNEEKKGKVHKIFLNKVQSKKNLATLS